MSSIRSEDAARRRLVADVKASLRGLNNQLSLLNRQVGGRTGLKDVDLDCLELLQAHGPLGPTALARLAGLHPATVTGVLDRLERGGWAVREREPGARDRRSVTVRALRDRNRELLGLYAGMNALMDEVCADYSEDDLALLTGFLRRTADAGRRATGDLADAD